jgi:hypothetical protein
LLPATLVNIVEPTVAPLKFTPGPVEGYYTLYMDPTLQSTFELREENRDMMDEDWARNDDDQRSDAMGEGEEEQLSFQDNNDEGWPSEEDPWSCSQSDE